MRMELEGWRIKYERAVQQHTEDMSKINKQLLKERSDNEPPQQGLKKLKLNTGSTSPIEKEENMEIKELKEDSIEFFY